MNIDNPKGLRKGQTIFNFLEWLKKEKGIDGNQSDRLADPFYIEDEAFDKYWEEFTSKQLN